MIDIGKLRNVAILAHGGAGKTSIAEALIFNTKATTRLGKVEHGNTVSDYEPEEVKRTGSIQTALVPCNWNDHKVNFLDTPRYDDFIGEVISALRVVEGAVIVVAAPSGVEVGTERSWSRCEEEGIPRLIFINKMDRENADFYRSLESIQAQFGRKCVPFQIPIGAEQSFKGFVDLLRLPDEVPDEVAEQVTEARERLIEGVAETDDALVAKYLEGEEITQEELAQGIKKAILSGDIVPVLVGSSTMNIGMAELLDVVVDCLPSPLEGRQVYATNVATGDLEEIDHDPAAPLAASVFKTTADPFVGKLSVFRVYGGTLQSNSEVWNQSREQGERIGQVYVLRGKNQDQAQEIGPGDIGAVSKLNATVTGDTLCQRDHRIVFEPVRFPVGYYTMAVSPKTKADVEKMSSALSRIVEEDPSLRVTREPDTSETLVSGLGDAHIEVNMERIRRKFGTDLELRLPRVPYKETITAVTRAEYKHKKQTGGHGQYGHVLIRLEPLDRGEGFSFGEEVVGGSVPKEYIPSVEKGVVKTLQEGVVAGFPVVDVKAILYDGSFHDVDSSGICFEIAGSYAMRKGVNEAQPILLEPIMKLTVTVPDNFSGEIMGDVNSKRGRIMGMVPENGETVIEAEVPQGELLRYATDLRALTQGRGSYVVEFSHYEGVPQNITQRVVEESKKAREAARA
ncbi:MAG: elongation factor G [Dehalococcoidia bacterium]|nr:elongation factor G [Dehalococcoidia bacterium]